SGGNAYHGSLFDFVRNNKFDALPYQFTTAKPGVSPFKWNDFGFEIDGPVRIPKLFNGRDKLFFMANDEWLIQRHNFIQVYSVPTPEMFNGDFRRWTGTIYDPASNPASKTPFPNNSIPLTSISPYTQKLLKYYNSATLPGTTNPFTSNYTQNNASPFDRDGFVLRMDFVESSKSQWTGRYSWVDEVVSNQTINISGSKILTNYEQYLGSNTSTFA